MRIQPQAARFKGRVARVRGVHGSSTLEMFDVHVGEGVNIIDNNPTEDDLSLDESQQPSSGEEDFAHEDSVETQETQTEEGGKPKRDRSLDGRLKQLDAKLADIKERERRLEERERVPMPPVRTGVELTAQEVEAKTLLTGKLGIADVDTIKKEVAALETRLTMNSRHDRLEDVYSGEDGRPKYDRREVEDFMRTRGDIFDPEIAYRELYRDELLDYEIKRATFGKKSQPYTATATSTDRGDSGAITAEKIEEMKSKGKAVYLPWYVKYRDKILALAAEGKL